MKACEHLHKKYSEIKEMKITELEQLIQYVHEYFLVQIAHTGSWLFDYFFMQLIFTTMA